MPVPTGAPYVSVASACVDCFHFCFSIRLVVVLDMVTEFEIARKAKFLISIESDIGVFGPELPDGICPRVRPAKYPEVIPGFRHRTIERLCRVAAPIGSPGIIIPIDHLDPLDVNGRAKAVDERRTAHWCPPA